MLKMSQRGLANAIGLTFQQLQNYEKGRNRVDAGRLHQLANLLKVDVAYFFEGSNGENQKVGLAGLPPYVAEFTELPEGKRLMQAFVRIQDRAIRRTITKLVDQLAD